MIKQRLRVSAVGPKDYNVAEVVVGWGNYIYILVYFFFDGETFDFFDYICQNVSTFGTRHGINFQLPSSCFLPVLKAPKLHCYNYILPCGYFRNTSRHLNRTVRKMVVGSLISSICSLLKIEPSFTAQVISYSIAFDRVRSCFI